MGNKDRQIAVLGKELEKQKRIFKANAHRGTNPDGSDEYWAAKAKFDGADRKIKELEKELARLHTGGTPLDPHKFDMKFAPPGVNMPAGVQLSPSQSKVKVVAKGVATKKSTSELLSELSEQKIIFKKNSGRAINPDGSDAYWEAKKKFDDAYRKITEIEKEIAERTG